MINRQGGAIPQTPEEMKDAKSSDLLTLPSKVQGTNCFNCLFVKNVDFANKLGWCGNKKVNQMVTPRMCCRYWDSPGSYKPWKA